MELSGWTIYWITRLDGLACFLLVSSLVCFVIAFIAGLWWAIETDFDRNSKLPCNITIISCLFGILFSFVLVFIPSTKEMATIYVLPKIVNNEKVQQIPGKLLDITNKQLDEWISSFEKQGNKPK